MQNSKILYVAVLLHCFLFFSVYGQNDFNIDFKQNDPVDYERDEQAQILSKHNEFLAKAIQEKDSTSIFYGHLYLASDYIDYNKYEEAAKILLQAEIFLSHTDNKLWQGRLLREQGILQCILENYQEAVSLLESALLASTFAKDTNNIAIILEQLGAAHINLNELEIAEDYYLQALPLVRKFCAPSSLTLTLGNMGVLNAYQKKYKEALKYYNEALTLGIELGEKHQQYLHEINIADLYVEMGDVDAAIQIYYELSPKLEESNFATLLSYNYEGLVTAYKARQDWKQAYYFQEKFKTIVDTLVGKQVQLKISALEILNEKHLRDLERHSFETTLAKQRVIKIRNTAIFIFTLILFGLGLLYLILRKRKMEADIVHNREKLEFLTKSLINKNSLLKIREDEIVDLKSHEGERIQDDAKNHFLETQNVSLYDLHILTDEDWNAFKSYFEKTYPGYIETLRKTHSELSEAEERLFLLMKLNLTNKEIALILGILPGSVKKTRSRLSRRLELSSTVSLGQYVKQF